MKSRCSSNRRCYSPSCESCAWRYSLGISRRILRHSPRRLFALTTAPNLLSPADFPCWRVQVRNLLDYRHRASKWWSDVGVWSWLSADGQVRGVTCLGSVADEEFLDVFGRRWPAALRVIDSVDLRHSLYLDALRPGVILDSGLGRSRYQPIKLAIQPPRKVSLASARVEMSWPLGSGDDAMPVLL
jgi:hypothetical protein